MPGRNKYAKASLKGLAKKYVDASTSTGQPTVSPPPSSKAVSDLIDLVVDRDVYYPIHSLITSYLGIDDIRNVQLVCKRTSALYTNMKKTQWNINTSLQPFFKDPLVFRSVQAKTETLIGSQIARKFFRRLQNKTDLQLFTKTGDKIDTIIEYLKQEGYLLKDDLPGDGDCGFSKLSRFKKTGPGCGSET